MSFPFLLEPVADCSEPICSDGEPLVTSNGTTTASESSLLASVMDSCQQPQSSLTCVSSHSPVQPTSTEELRMWLQQAFPVSRLALLDGNLQKTTSGTCGQQPRMSFAVFDQSASCWKTSQVSLFADTPESCSPTWPQWGTWDGTAAYPLPIPAQITSAPDGGSWPTPLARDARTLLGAARSEASLGTDPLAWEVAQREFSANGLPIPHGARLNPEWVEWLQGFPMGWTDLKPLAIHKYREWLQQHSPFSHDETDNHHDHRQEPR